MALLPEGDRYGLVWTMTPATAERGAGAARRRVPARRSRGTSARASRASRAWRERTHVSAGAGVRAAARWRRASSSSAMRRRRCIRSPGQGFNLGLRDAFELAQAIIDAPRDALGDARDARALSRRGGAPTATPASRSRTASTQLFAHRRCRCVRWPRGIALDAARRAAAGEAGVHARDAVRLVLNARSLARRARRLSRLRKFAHVRTCTRAKPV